MARKNHNNKEKILVTGGAGYVGPFIVNMLLEKGYKVVVLDKLIYGEKGLHSFLGKPNLEFIKGDITDPEIIDRAVRGTDIVIALAAIVGDAACAVNEELTWAINYESIKLLTDTSIKYKIKRLIFASSCSVYGSNGDIRLLTEDSHLNPVSVYAKTRIKSEEYLRDKSDLIPSVILRLSTIFGLSARMRFDLAINTMTAKAVTTNSIEVFGGDQWRPFVHVRDVAKAFVMAVEAEDKIVNGQVFNVGSTDSNYRINDIAGIIAEEVPGTKINSSSTLVDMRNYNVIFDKIHKKLNFKTKYSVRDGVREMSRFVGNNKNLDINSKEFNNYSVWKELGKIDKYLPYSVPDIGKEEKDEVINTINSGWLSTGPKTRLFEEKIKEYFEDDELEVIAVSSCTAGLHLQLLAAGIGPGDEVITTPLTFCATVNSIIYTGATPVLADVDPLTFNLDLDLIENKITERTRAIVPVYYGGQAVDHTKLESIARKYELLILADAAHAMGAKYDAKYCGTYEDSAAFSFYATKNMAIGEGGMVTTHNTEMAEKIRRLLTHGMNKDAWKRFSEAGSWYYEITDLGFKYNFTDMQAALGIHQLKKIDHFNNIRRNFGAIYDEAFEEISGLRIHGTDCRAFNTRHLYPIVIDEDNIGISRNKFIEKLKEQKIGTSVHYVPIHYHPYYQKRFNLDPADFPVTNEIYKGLISLPIYTRMTVDDVKRVIEAVIKIIDGARHNRFTSPPEHKKIPLENSATSLLVN